MKYGEEIKFQLVERYCKGESISDICLESGVRRSTFYTWLKLYKVSHTEAGTVVSGVEFVKMKKRVVMLEETIEILKTVDCTNQAPLKEKLNELELLYGQYSVRALCRALDVSRGTFYNHVLRNKKDDNYNRNRRDYLGEKIEKIFNDNKQIFGAKKIKAILSEQGEVASEKFISELMQEMNLYSVRTNSKKIYLSLNKDIKKERMKDKLKMQFEANAPNIALVSDTTQYEVKGQVYYICVIIDLYSRKIIGYSISQKHNTRLVAKAFRIAYEERQPNDGLLFHSDRGTQYASYVFRRLLKTCNVNQSYSPKGKPYNNSVMESFFASMKKEELYRNNYRSINDF